MTTARGLASAERIVEVLDTQPDLQDLPGAVPAPPFEGRVQFENVSFGYDPDHLVLQDVTFDVKPGSITALVGATGSGKTTLLSLIPRFYDPTAGTVCIDGRDIRDYSLKSLRSQVALVLQEPVLFRATIYDNIAYGNPNATREDICAAAEAANVVEFVNDLPQGYDTVVGERGASLSGGQRQRVSIARALVRNAPILLLDEPTTGLDVETEGLVLEALRRLMAGRTTFVIAHHLSTIQSADMIMVLKAGQIIERGSHDELLARSGTYARLYKMQVSNLHGLRMDRRVHSGG
jgi:ABC-type multidrug transport system fused ATPase/permease subunit